MAPSRAILRQLGGRVAASTSMSSMALRQASTRCSAAITSTRPIVPRISPSVSNQRWNSTVPTEAGVEAPDYLDEKELKIFNMLKEELQPTKLEVQDVSGGCGSMYALDIVSAKFKGLPVIKQHRLVNSVLGEEIKKWHGVQLKTKAP